MEGRQRKGKLKLFSNDLIHQQITMNKVMAVLRYVIIMFHLKILYRTSHTLGLHVMCLHLRIAPIFDTILQLKKVEY